jgi:hypothetical protein
MTEALRRPLDMLSACLSAGRTFHVLEKWGPMGWISQTTSSSRIKWLLHNPGLLKA